MPAGVGCMKKWKIFPSRLSSLTSSGGKKIGSIVLMRFWFTEDLFFHYLRWKLLLLLSPIAEVPGNLSLIDREASNIRNKSLREYQLIISSRVFDKSQFVEQCQFCWTTKIVSLGKGSNRNKESGHYICSAFPTAGINRLDQRHILGTLCVPVRHLSDMLKHAAGRMKKNKLFSGSEYRGMLRPFKSFFSLQNRASL